MNTIHLRLSVIVCLFASACAQKPAILPSTAQALEIEKQRRQQESDGREYQRESRERFIVPPRTGMTREQVRAEYGRPLTVSISDRTEIWSYHFNATDARPASPFRDTSTIVRCTVTFSPQTGKVSRFSWTASNPAARG